jgi:hypothetical protein
MSGRTRHIKAEPISIGTDTVANFLDSIGWSRSADLVREIGKRSQEANLSADRWQKRYYELLNKYEPPAPRLPPPNYQPPPEASD